MNRIDFLGLPLDGMTVEELHRCIAETVQRGERALIGNLNANAVNLAHENQAFRRFLGRCTWVFCDGFGVRLGARLLGHRLPPRITYADWVPELARFCGDKKLSLFLLGGRDDVLADAKAALQQIAPELKIVGAHSGFFDHEPDSPDNLAVRSAIHKATPDILLVAMGMPLQEEWLLENWSSVSVPIGLNGGAVLSYVAGHTKRAPPWMRRIGLEWLGRLCIEPRRLWRRYLLGNTRFLLRVLFKKRLLDGICG